MAIPYTIVKQKNPRNTNQTLYYPRAASNGVVELEEIIYKLEQMSTLSGADIEAVLYGLTDLAARELSNGKIVRFGRMGSFRITFEASASEASDTIGPNNIRRAKLQFTPAKRFKQMLDTVEFTKR
jgi:predicted histone-like DNA-binding protein